MTFKEVVRLAGQAAGKADAKDKIVIYDPAAKKVGMDTQICIYMFVYVCVSLMRWCECFFGTGRSPMVRAPCAHTHNP